MREKVFDERDAAARARLEELLALPLPEDSDNLNDYELFAPWRAFDGVVSSYDSEIDRMAISTLKAVRDGTVFRLLEGEHRLFVQFFLHVLAAHDYVEYGTSPRAAFPGHGVSDLMTEWIKKWKAWHRVSWGCEPEIEG